MRRLWYLLRKRRYEEDLAEELVLHRELAEREHERRGQAPADAAAAARRTLGSSLLARDDARDVWMWAWLQDIAQDVRFAVRLLAKDRRFTFAAVVALGLGIGVNNSVFRVVNSALIRDLPFDEPGRLYELEVRDRNGRTRGVSYPELRDWQQDAATFVGIAASTHGVMNVSDEGRAPARLHGSYVSANAFSLLRSRPALGRDFLPEDERPGAPAIVMLGHAVWTERYGGDPTVVGRTVRVNNVPSTIVGVMPAGFKFPFIAEAWQPLTLSAEVAGAGRDKRILRSVFGRLADSVDSARAHADIQAIADRLAQAYPDGTKDLSVSVERLKDGYPPRMVLPMLMTFMGAVGCVLLIACANVANLLLARAASRSREIAIRASLGATRWRIVRQLLVECLVIATLASGVGIALSVYPARLLAIGFSPIEPGVAAGDLVPFWLDLSMDATALMFVGGACLLATLAFGLVPALQVARTNVNRVLSEGGRTGATGLRARRWTGAFIVVELALTVILLAGTGLLWRSFLALYKADVIVDTTGVVTTRLTLPDAKYDTPEKRQQFLDLLEARLGGLAALSSVTLASEMPLTPGGASRRVVIDGRDEPPDAEPSTVSYVNTGMRYFETMGLRVLKGRAFEASDGAAGREAAVVDQRFATLFFPNEDPVGRRIRLASSEPTGAGPLSATIIGVAQSVAHPNPERPGPPVVYVPFRGEPLPGATVSIMARSRTGLAAVAALLREQVRALDPDLPLYGTESLDAAVARTRFPQQWLGSWFGLLAGIALVLASVGVYGLTAQGVAQRTQEIGVRVALGAQAAHVRWLFLRRTVVQLAIGLTLGIGGALATGKLLQTFLVGTGARDPLTLGAVALLLAGVALAASLVPARRASRLDPVAALRRD